MINKHDLRSAANNIYKLAEEQLVAGTFTPILVLIGDGIKTFPLLSPVDKWNKFIKDMIMIEKPVGVVLIYSSLCERAKLGKRPEKNLSYEEVLMMTDFKYKKQLLVVTAKSKEHEFQFFREIDYDKKGKAILGKLHNSKTGKVWTTFFEGVYEQ